MNQTLEIIRKKHGLPALAVVVVKDGQICDRVAVGVRKWGDPTPATTNDLFHIGSDTKSMTATLTAMLIDEGKLRWDTTIADVFPELKGKMDKQYEAVTVEQLLTHRGGVPGTPPAVAWKRAWAQQGTPMQQRYEFIEAVLDQSPEAAPGTKYIYSNQGYAIIGAMLEKLTGTPWETLITERLFKPLRMDSAGFGPPGTSVMLTSLGVTFVNWMSPCLCRKIIHPPSRPLQPCIVFVGRPRTLHDFSYAAQSDGWSLET